MADEKDKKPQDPQGGAEDNNQDNKETVQVDEKLQELTEAVETAQGSLKEAEEALAAYEAEKAKEARELELKSRPTYKYKNNHYRFKADAPEVFNHAGKSTSQEKAIKSKTIMPVLIAGNSNLIEKIY